MDQCVLIPDLWGKSSDLKLVLIRLVLKVLIPDLWGKSSDQQSHAPSRQVQVLIPDLWGKSSDCNLLKIPLVFNRLKDVFWIPNFLTIKNIA